MTNEELIELLNHDLQNEFQHMNFYLHASVMVQSLFREELREWLYEEAKSEMDHVEQFSRMVTYLGGYPVRLGHEIPDIDYTQPQHVLKAAVELEQKVADNYSQRLRQTESHQNAAVSRVHVFYEDQISDSWDTARELEWTLKKLVDIR